MTDDILFEFLHTEIVNYTLESNELKNPDTKVNTFVAKIKII